MAALVSPIVNIILRLWTCCARHTRYLRKLQKNKDLLSTAMDELKEARDDVQRRVVVEEEADPNEPKKPTEQVRGWLERVQIIEGKVEKILQKEDAQLSRARCLGGCCPPNNCWSNYKLGKSITKKIPLVKDLKVKGDFQELTFVVRPMNYLSKLQDNKILLKNAMEELKNVRNDVHRKVVEAEAHHSEPKMRTDQVHGWLQSVENIEGEVEVIMQTSDEQLTNAECHEKDKLVVMKMASVGELERNGHFEEVTYRLPPPPVQPMNLEPTVGMESMFDKVWRLINNSTDDKPVRIMGLYGPGGVGKTTLLEKINNEYNKISEHDHVVIFAVVSKQIDVQAIQTQIGERLRLSLQGNERRRANEIFNKLRNKKFVILLDDLWGRVDLKLIGIPSPLTQCKSSKVIFTTRNEEVCGNMEFTHKFPVECLPWNTTWRLFQDKVGEDALTSFPGARELAKDVAKECGGLPLALITIGRAMSTKKSIEQWRDAIKTLRSYASKFEGMSDEVLPRLKLSYDNLSDETKKSCFCYCALFPEDHSIKITDLVDYWIAEGFLDRFDNNLDEARDHGNTIIGSLKSACLLESSGEDDVKMHDVIRDLALWIVNDCKSSSNTTGKFLVASNVSGRWRNAERIFWNVLEWEEPPASHNLRTLLVRPGSASIPNFSLPQSFFQFTPFLRVLDMRDIPLEKLPTSICKLYELQYLNLSKTKITELPDEIGQLCSLTELSLNDSAIEAIPDSIGNLINLEILSIYRCRSITTIPDSIGNLKSLVELLLGGNTFEELPDSMFLLSRLKHLSLSNCQNLKQLPASIGGLVSLVELFMDRTSITELPDEIGNLTKLEKLEMRGYELLSRLPDPIGNMSSLTTFLLTNAKITELPKSIGQLKKLQVLNVNNCKRLSGLPASFGELESLRELHMERTGVTYLPKEFGMLSRLMVLKMGKRPQPRDTEDPKFAVLPDEFSNLSLLYELDASYCKISGIIPDAFEKLSSLEDLKLNHNHFCRLPSSLRGLVLLKRLSLSHCTKLKLLPPLPSSLNFLDVTNCTALERISDLSNLENLSEIRLTNCKKVTDIPGLKCLSLLKRLYLGGCNACFTSIRKRLHKDALERLRNLCVPGSEIPSWLIQEVPSFLRPRNREIKGVIICVVISLQQQQYPDDLRSELPAIVDIQAKIIRNNRPIFTTTLYLMGVPDTSEDQMHLCRYVHSSPFVSHLEEGDNIQVVMRNPLVFQGLQLKKYGIHLVFEDDDDIDDDDETMDETELSVTQRLANYVSVVA